MDAFRSAFRLLQENTVKKDDFCTKCAISKVGAFFLPPPKFAKLTGCELPCEREEYEVTPVSEQEIPASPGNLDSSSSRTILQFYIDPPYITVREEYPVYDWAAAAGDVGGMMGMLLGISCLALVKDFAAVLLRMARAMGKEK